MSIQASTRQATNPLLKVLRRVKVDILPDSELAELSVFDFIVNVSIRLPILYLTLTFHESFKEYIGHRISHVVSLPTASSQNQPPLLLVLVDIDDPTAIESALEEITIACTLNGVRLLLAWTPDEAARILEILHVFGPDRAADVARGAISTVNARGALSNSEQALTQAKEALVTIQGGVGQKDSQTLLTNFKSLRRLASASKTDLANVPSIGSKKSQHIHSVFNATW